MERSSKRGKIPQSDWPSIMARYEAGETLSSIARTYDCSPPAISYVVSRSRARQPGHAQPPREAPRPPAIGEPQLIKASAAATAGPAAASDPPHADQLQAPAPQRQPQPQGSNGGYRPAWANTGPQHQSAAPEPQHQRPAPSTDQSTNHQPAPPQHTNGGHPGNGGRPESHGEARKENGAFIDRELRARVEADITAFLAAFDAALAEDTPGSRVGLREATDRLLRAGARTRIELERLEARMPLPPRDTGRQNEPAWRQR